MMELLFKNKVKAGNSVSWDAYHAINKQSKNDPLFTVLLLP